MGGSDHGLAGEAGGRMSPHARTPWVTRARAQRSSLAAVALTTLVLSFALTAIVGWGWRSPVVAVSQTLASTSATDRSVIVTEDLARDSSSQDASVRRTIAATFRQAPIEVVRTVVEGPWQLAGAKSDLSVMFVRSSPGVTGDIRTTAGSVATLTGDDVAIDSVGAKALGVSVGDTLGVTVNSGDLTLHIVAVWEPKNPRSLDWAGVPAGVEGTTARLIVGKTTISAAASTPQSRWAVAPNTELVRPADLDSLAFGFSHLEAEMSKNAPTDAAAPTVTGRGAEPVTAMQRSIAAVGQVLPVAIAVLSLSAVVAVTLLAILLAAARASETRLLRARGSSLRTFVGIGILESLGVALPGALLGAILAQLALLAALTPPVSALEPIIAPVVATVLTVTATTMVGAITAAETEGADRSESGRARTTAFIGIAALLVAAAGLTLWRFLLYGVPGPGQTADPSGVLAPAAVLCALAVLSLLLLTPLTATLERRTARLSGIDRVLPARQLRRNTLVFAGPVALLVLAIGSSSVAAGYSATFTSFLAGSSKLINGSDVRVAFDGIATATDASVLVDRRPYDRIDGVRSVTPVLRTDATSGDSSLSVIGVPADRLAGLVGSSVENPGAVSEAIRPAKSTLTGVPIPTGAGRLSLAMSAVRSDDQTSPKLVTAAAFATVWLADPLGDISPVTLDSVPITPKSSQASSTVHATIPRGGPWMLVAIDVGVHAPATLRGLEVRVTSLSAGAILAVPSGQHWVPQSAVFDAGAKAISDDGVIGFSRASVRANDVDSTIVRLMPDGSATVPVVLSRTAASLANLGVGDTLDVDGTWASFPATVAAVTTLIPGVSGSPALLADLPSLENGMLRTSQQVPAIDELWMASAAPEAAVRSASTVARPSATVSAEIGAAQGRFMSAAIAGLWIGAVGCAIFAIIALAAALAVFTRRRAGEVGILRALGVTDADQVRMRRSEILFITGYSALAGIVAGVAVSLLTLSTLTRLSSAVGAQTLPVALRLDVGWLALIVALLVAATAVVTSRATKDIRSVASGVGR